MALRFEHGFVVNAPCDRVWSHLTDPYFVASALPGAAITGKVDDHTYSGTITVKVGPVTVRYKGTARFEKVDPAARTVEMAASGQDTGGRGGADLKMQSHIVELAPEETRASATFDVSITGVLAQFGRGMIQDVSDQMFKRFTEAVKAELEKPPAATGEAGVPQTPPVTQHLAPGATAQDASRSRPHLIAGAGAAAPSVPEPAPSVALENVAESAPQDAAAKANGPETATPEAVEPQAGAVSIELTSLGGALRAMRRPVFWIVAVFVLVVSWIFFR